MSNYKVGYFVGSLSTSSINRLLAKALVRLAPAELEMIEIPIGTFRYTTAITTMTTRQWREPSRTRSQRWTRCCSSHRSTTARSLAR